jgi:tRNA(Ile)-lysidine synthase
MNYWPNGTTIIFPLVPNRMRNKITPLTYFVGLSGGIDSVVLLHFMKNFLEINNEKNYRLKAIHVNHQILPQSKEFEHQCQRLCQKLQVPLEILQTRIQKKSGESIEALARDARYELIEKKLARNDIFLTGHHLDDQAETLLLQLLRGAGLKGVSAMPKCSALGEGFLLRPLLTFSRETLKEYANYYALDYINDPSNANENYDRNYLRHTIIPLLKQRWPQTANIFSRFSSHCAQQEKILQELAHLDYSLCMGKSPNTLNLLKLNDLSAARQKNVLRHWINTFFSFQNSSLPEKILEEIRSTFFAAIDKNPLIKVNIKIKRALDKIGFRRFQHTLYLLLETELKQRPRLLTSEEKKWCQKNISGFKSDPKKYRVCFRQNGEKAWVEKSTQHKSLKKLFQEWRIPPWLRNQIPLIYFRQKLIAVVGYAVFEN